MENQRDKNQTGPTEDTDNPQRPTGEQHEQPPKSEQQGQQPTDQTADQNRGGGMGGQPIGGNDSNTGSGTTLSAGYTPPSEGQNEGQNQNQGQSASGQTQTSGDAPAGEQNSGQGSDQSGGGFVGAQGGQDSSDYLREDDRSDDEAKAATDDPTGAGGTDFAKQGRGANQQQGEESIETPAGGSASPDDGSGSGGGSF